MSREEKEGSHYDWSKSRHTSHHGIPLPTDQVGSFCPTRSISKRRIPHMRGGRQQPGPKLESRQSLRCTFGIITPPWPRSSHQSPLPRRLVSCLSFVPVTAGRVYASSDDSSSKCPTPHWAYLSWIRYRQLLSENHHDPPSTLHRDLSSLDSATAPFWSSERKRPRSSMMSRAMRDRMINRRSRNSLARGRLVSRLDTFTFFIGMGHLLIRFTL